jgi:Pyruvate/2-oxoacid:ferredoxin oxidoreductase delta subunit
MGTIDISNATRPKRTRVGGVDKTRAAHFRKRFPPTAKRHLFIRDEILAPMRDSPVNPARTEIDDPAAVTEHIKALARDMGAHAVGVAAYDPRFTFSQVEDPPAHDFVIMFALAMEYDCMADIGPRSQEEVHRVYYSLDDIGVRLAHHIGAFGYSARMQPNGGDIPLPVYGWLAGLGELGKHGSLISPELGSSFRLAAVTTDMPLVADGAADHGIDEVCASCDMCTRFCPGDAIRPDKFDVNGVTRWHVDTPACEPYFHKLYGCKICLMVCPLNARGKFRDAFKALSKDLVVTKDSGGLLALIESRTDLKYEEFDYAQNDGGDDSGENDPGEKD